MSNRLNRHTELHALLARLNLQAWRASILPWPSMRPKRA